MSSAVYQEARTAHYAGDYKKAAELARAAQKREPRSLDAFRLLGLAYIGQGKAHKALEVMHKGWEAHPNDPILAANIAAQYWFIGQDDLAMKWIHRAPVTVATAYTRSLLLLKYGDYERGWRDYDLRFEVGQSKLLMPRETMWDGKRLNPDDSLTIWSEQGVGDVVQFSRFIPLAKERAGCKIKFGVNPQTYRLFEGFTGVDELTRAVGGIHIPLMSLPRVLGVTLEDLSGATYLMPSKRTERNTELGRAPIVGLCWQSGTKGAEYADRNVPVRYLQGIREMSPDVQCRNLQYGEDGFLPTDFYETAQAIAQCDLVITSDTSVAHIAGAMGIPTWIMLRYQGCFRWLREREDSPWYDSVKLYRQPNLGNWQHVVDRVVTDLKELVNGRTNNNTCRA